jgi:pre-mRNA-processing factor SLU7
LKKAKKGAKGSDSDDQSSDSDSDSDSDVDNDSDQEDEKDTIKTDFLNRDENARDFQYQFGRQGGVGGNELKLTSRNLRIREDTPKYLRNLALNSAFYDPKSRSMRDNPYPDANPDDLVYAGDNFSRQSGDALKLAATQVLCWEMQGGNIGGVNEDGQMVDAITNPSQAEYYQKQFLEKKKALAESKQRAILEKYGNNSSLAAINSVTADIRLRLGQTEAYVEYSRDGRVIKGPGSNNNIKVSSKTKYEEDVYINNHTSVWGSYYHRGQMSWGYACCHSLIKNSYCVGSKGIESNDLASGAKMALHEQQLKKAIVETVNTAKNPSSSTSTTQKSSSHVKRSDIYGESSLDPSSQLDESKLKESLTHMKQQQSQGNSGDLEEEMNNKSKKRGSYHSMKGVDVSIEDMEAYRMTKIRRDDPMEKFLSSDHD